MKSRASPLYTKQDPPLEACPVVSLHVLSKVICTYASIQECGPYFPSKENHCFTFYVEIMVDLHADVRNNTEIASLYPSPRSPPNSGNILHNHNTTLQSGG